MHQCIKFVLFWNDNLHITAVCLLASTRCSISYSLASRQHYLFDKCLLLYIQSRTPDDGREDRPKHVECHYKIKQIGASSWFYYRNNITMHGPMNVKLLYVFASLVSLGTFSKYSHYYFAGWPGFSCLVYTFHYKVHHTTDITLQTSHYRHHTTDITLQTSHYRHHTADITLQTSHYRHHTADITLQTSHYRHHTADITLQTSHCRHHITDITLQTSHCRHHTADITLQTSHCRHHTADITLQTSNCTEMEVVLFIFRQSFAILKYISVKVSRHVIFYGRRLSVPRPIPDMENQVSLFMTLGDRVAQFDIQRT